jgi:glycosyltransferase involved in cell wall biosynthesis
VRVVLDGGVCFDRFGGCYNYHMQVVPRLVEQGISVTVTPSPTGALDALTGSGAEVTQTVLPRGSWLPNGAFRRSLSRVKRKLEAWRWNRRLDQSPEPVIFQSYYYSAPPTPNVVFVPMIMDMIQEKFPQWYAQGFDVLKQMKLDCVRRATRIIAISEVTRQDVIDYYGVDPSKVDVVYIGIHPAFDQPPSPPVEQTMRAKLGNANPYFLQVGGRALHKNFERMLEAFAIFAADEKMDLVCAGEVWSDEETAQIARLGLKHRVHLVHRPNQSELISLYHLSQGLIYPSIYEGFGLPPVEAMACGVPVAASSGGSIPEVVGDAAILFDPLSVVSMVSAMRQLREPSVAAELCRRGRERRAQFSWDVIALSTEAVYGRALSDFQSSTSLGRGVENTATVPAT